MSSPSSSEVDLAYAVVGDLFGPIADDIVASLPEPRRHAFEVALALRAPPPRAVGRTTVALAMLDAVRRAAEDRPLLIAIDDAHWIDRASTRALSFALRRLADERIGVFLTARSSLDDPALEVLDGFSGEVQRVIVPPLDHAAIARLIMERVSTDLPHHVVDRIDAQSGGNPFYAIELAEAVMRRGSLPGPFDLLPLPGSLRAVMSERLDRLSPAGWRVVTLAACASRPTVHLISEVLPEALASEGLDAAVDAGVMTVHDADVRFVHPLLAAAVTAAAAPAERRELHAALATVTKDVEQRAYHLALSTAMPDAAVAGQLEKASTHAARRGAPGVAAVLTEDALRLTPPDRADDAERRSLAAIDGYISAGDHIAAARVVEARLPDAAAGTSRAALLARLGEIRGKQAGFAEAEALLRRAAEETTADVRLRSVIQYEIAFARMQLGDMASTMVHAQEALELARETEDRRLITDMTVRLAAFRFVTGSPLDAETLAAMRASRDMEEPDRMGIEPMFNLAGVVGYVMKSSDLFEEARAAFEASYRSAVARGSDAALPAVLSQMSELAFWRGDWDEAERLATIGMEILDVVDQRSTVGPALEYCLAMVSAARGDIGAGRELVLRARDVAERNHIEPMALMAESALASMDLASGDATSTYRRLGAVASRVVEMGAGEPGVLRFMADAIEAAVAIGDLDEASRLTDYLEVRGRDLDRPFALATGARCRALLSAARGDVHGAIDAIERALHEHERLAMPLEQGRTLLAAGTIRRRAKQKRAAREALGSALAIFDDLGAQLWADRARAELARVSVHPAAVDQLTPTEERIAELVAAGRTNREVASSLSISVKTVDSNLTRIYRKLGVRSRTELARAFLLRDSSDSTGRAAT